MAFAFLEEIKNEFNNKYTAEEKRDAVSLSLSTSFGFVLKVKMVFKLNSSSIKVI